MRYKYVWQTSLVQVEEYIDVPDIEPSTWLNGSTLGCNGLDGLGIVAPSIPLQCTSKPLRLRGN